MLNVIDVASYIFFRYKKENNEEIDEMKLHKLLYFAQRESFILNNEPLFSAKFTGYAFGPVMKEIRDYYKNRSFSELAEKNQLLKLEKIMDSVFQRYAKSKSMSLSRISCGELSWHNSRIGISDYDNNGNLMETSDIAKDAQLTKERRELSSCLTIVERSILGERIRKIS